MVGVINDSFYYRQSFQSANAEITRIKNGAQADANTKTHMQQLTEAMFETAKSFLCHNKKN